MSTIDSEGRTIWIADAQRGDGKRFVVRADEKPTSFMELGSANRACGEFSWRADEIFLKKFGIRVSNHEITPAARSSLIRTALWLR